MPRKPRLSEPITPELAELIRLVRSSEPAHIQRYYLDQMNRRIDEELEQMVIWILSDWDPDIDSDRIKSLMAAGQFRMATNAIIAKMRREVAEELKRHKRTKVDALLEA